MTVCIVLESATLVACVLLPPLDTLYVHIIIPPLDTFCFFVKNFEIKTDPGLSHIVSHINPNANGWFHKKLHLVLCCLQSLDAILAKKQKTVKTHSSRPPRRLAALLDD